MQKTETTSGEPFRVSRRQAGREVRVLFSAFRQGLGRGLARYLTRDLPGYRRLDTITMGQFAAVLQPADIILVEGNSRISRAVKALTRSPWSHACLFVGRAGDPPATPNLLEADLQDGVRVVSLEYYARFNLRICRPVGLSLGERQSLIAFARARLGHRYDLRNVLDLLRYLLPQPPVSERLLRSMIGFGSGDPTRAICSSLIAEAFQSINYPILPLRGEDGGSGGELPAYYRRHFTHFLPRDFDLSPYFRVVKPTIEVGFDHRQFWDR